MDELWLTNGTNSTIPCSLLGIDNEGVMMDYTSVERTESWFPDVMAVPLYGYAMPVLLIVTTITNIFVIAVLTQREMLNSTNIILVAISLSDLLMILFPAFMFIYMYTLGNYKYPLYPLSVCYLWGLTADILPNFFHTASIWLTLILALQRYIYVCHVNLAKEWCQKANACKAIAIIFIIAGIHQFGRIWEFHYKAVCYKENDEFYPACERVMGFLAKSHHYFPVYFWFRLFFVHLGPCLILVILNSLLSVALYQAQKRRRLLISENARRDGIDADRTTAMLIVVVSVFLITEIPLAVITLLHILIGYGLLEEYDTKKVQLFFIISNSFIIFMYPVNFAIYCGMSKLFRVTFRKLFCEICYPRTHLQREGSSRFSVGNGYKSCTNETVL